MLIEDIGSFQFEGIKVFAAGLRYWNAADRLQLVDWKTGGAGADAALQLGGYALYALETMGVDPARVDLLEVNLREGKVTTHPWGSLDLDRVRDHIRLSVRSMRAYLKDPDRNLAEEADFEKAEDQRICRWCNFRAVCRPEMATSRPPRSMFPSPSRANEALLPISTTPFSTTPAEWRKLGARLPQWRRPGSTSALSCRRWRGRVAGSGTTGAARRERTNMNGAWRQIVAHALEGLGRRTRGWPPRWPRPLPSSLGRMALYPGAREALTRLRERGVLWRWSPTGTRASTAQDREHDLARFFDVIVIEASSGWGSRRVGLSPRARALGCRLASRGWWATTSNGTWRRRSGSGSAPPG